MTMLMQHFSSVCTFCPFCVACIVYNIIFGIIIGQLGYSEYTTLHCQWKDDTAREKTGLHMPKPGHNEVSNISYPWLPRDSLRACFSSTCIL